MVALLDAFDALAALEEGGLHRTRLVHVEVDIDAVALGAVHEPTQIGDSLFVIGAHLGKEGTGSELTQHDVQPDAVDADVGQLLEQAVGIGVELGIEQGIAEDAAIGVEEANLPFAGGGSLTRPSRLGDG